MLSDDAFKENSQRRSSHRSLLISLKFWTFGPLVVTGVIKGSASQGVRLGSLRLTLHSKLGARSASPLVRMFVMRLDLNFCAAAVGCGGLQLECKVFQRQRC